MKHFIALAAFVISSAANATIHTVTCQNGASHFLPVTVNAVVGDTIYWTWVSGNHVVGPINSSDIPTGALMWNANINSGFLDFEYVVPVPGTYHYVCHPAAPHGEDGYIVVSSATQVQGDDLPGSASPIYPNPFSGNLIIDPQDADQIMIRDLLGNEVVSSAVENGHAKLQLDLGHLPKGVYICTAMRNGVVVESRRVVKN